MKFIKMIKEHKSFKLIKSIFNKKHSKENALLTPLSPIDNFDLGIYKEALDYALTTDNVRNIALSGAYGSGKSSILKSYFKLRSEKSYKISKKNDYLQISLAHFDINEKEKLIIKRKKSIQRKSLLEWKIINQLIHQINPRKIPQTKFQIKKKVSILKTFLISITLFFFCFSTFYVFFFEKWQILYEGLSCERLKNKLEFSILTETWLIFLIISLILAGFGIFYIIRMHRNQSRIKKLGIKGAQIEMFTKDGESYFDKYLNDVLYIFENCKCNIIVFEDIDRYESTIIFERLREINILINNSRDMKRKRRRFLRKCIPPMRFLYLLKDDIFSSTDRLKFFDLIIPVIPIVDGSNAYDTFLEVFDKYGMINHFSTKFLKGFSLYIDEMRTIINICNEYLVYGKRLGHSGTEIDRNKLLALIAYKNLFPNDFIELQLGRGFIFTLMNSKDALVHSAYSAIIQEIEEINKDIERVRNEHLQSEQEADQLFKEELTDAEKRLSNYPNRSDIQEEVNNIKAKIVQRKSYISKKSSEGQGVLQSKITDKENQLRELHGKRIKDLLTRENIDAAFNNLNYTSPLEESNNFKVVKGSHYFDLLKYLIRNGYIDETYMDYMTYFKEKSISARDKAFCRSVTDQVAKPADYVIDNPENVIEILPAEYFSQIEVFNYTILDFLLMKQNPSEQLSLFLKKLAEVKQRAFVIAFLKRIEYGDKFDRFIKAINEVWPSLFYELSKSDNLDNEFMDAYILSTIWTSPDEYILTINVECCLQDYLENKSTFLQASSKKIGATSAKRIANGLELLNVKFTRVNVKNANGYLVNEVYMRNLYILSFENISYFLQKDYDFAINSDFNHRNYSLVLTQPESSLAMYINKNMSEYINTILSNSGELITDDEAVVTIILNSEIVESRKIEYISFLGTKITSIIEINDIEIWVYLVRNENALLYSEDNIINYCHNRGWVFDDALVNWINNQKTILDFSKEKLFGQENDSRDKFLKAIVLCDSLDDIRYTEFLQSLNRIYNVFKFENISNSKMTILINNKIISMNSENLIFIREKYYTEIVYGFITKNIKEYIVLLDEQVNLRDDDELDYIISLKSGVPINNQKQLLSQLTDVVSIKNKPYSDEIIHFIVENNFEETDYLYLVKNYDKYSATLKNTIGELFNKYSSEIINEMFPVSKSFFDDQYKAERLSTPLCEKLLALALPSIELKEIISYLTEYGLERFSEILNKRKKPQFGNTNLNKYILDCFIKWGKVKEYKTGANGNIYIKR